MGNIGSVSADINSFRNAVSAGTMPHSSSITYGGIFNENFFLMNDALDRNQLVSTELHHAEVINNRGQVEYWLACFVKTKQDGLKRTLPIDVSIVIDVSGSMASVLPSESGESGEKSCLTLAKECALGLAHQLNSEDKFAISTFDDQETVVMPMTEVSQIDLEELSSKLEAINTAGGTVVAAGMRGGLDRFEKYDPAKDRRRERRMIMITDMYTMECDVLKKEMERGLQDKIYTSIVGIGISFCTEVTETIVKVPCANYFSATKSEQLERIVNTNFDFNFFPVARDVELSLHSGVFFLEAIYGVSEDESPQSELPVAWKPATHKYYPLKVRKTVETLLLTLKRKRFHLPNTGLQRVAEFLAPKFEFINDIKSVFPSSLTKNNEMEGGLILMKLNTNKDKVEDFDQLKAAYAQIVLSYKDMEGTETLANSSTVEIPLSIPESKYQSTTIRKGIALQRYVRHCKSLLSSETDAKDLGKFNEFLGDLQKEADDLRDAKLDEAVKLSTKLAESMKEQLEQQS